MHLGLLLCAQGFPLDAHAQCLEDVLGWAEGSRCRSAHCPGLATCWLCEAVRLRVGKTPTGVKAMALLLLSEPAALGWSGLHPRWTGPCHPWANSGQRGRPRCTHGQEAVLQVRRRCSDRLGSLPAARAAGSASPAPSCPAWGRPCVGLFRRSLKVTVHSTGSQEALQPGPRGDVPLLLVPPTQRQPHLLSGRAGKSVGCREAGCCGRP